VRDGGFIVAKREPAAALRGRPSTELRNAVRFLFATDVLRCRPMDRDAVGRPDTVLVADDEPEIRDLLHLLLADAGYRVVTAVDGHEALELAARERPDVILLDAGMPRLDGAGFCRAYHEDGGTVPIVLISAGDPKVIAETVEACGAVAYIAKPFEIEHVLETVERLIHP
jgi:two-component system, chemotaxis family, chemotaxis protein CheY